MGARESALTLFEANPTAATPDGKATLVQAVNELVYNAALTAVNNDPTRPRAVWIATSPHFWFGHEVPGSRWGIDNPDNVYRNIPVDVDLQLRDHRPSAQVRSGPVQLLHLRQLRGRGRQDRGSRQARRRPPRQGHPGRPRRLVHLDCRRRPGQRSPEPHPEHLRRPLHSLPEHLQPMEPSRARKTSKSESWAVRGPTRRPTRPSPRPPSSSSTRRLRRIWPSRAGALSLAPNTICTPSVRGGNWGFATSGHWAVADDEAVVVTINPSGAKYLGFDLTDCLASLPAAHRPYRQLERPSGGGKRRRHLHIRHRHARSGLCQLG